ncbi:MAG TPA: uracil-DNA glycosylase [Syntrophales bacterium]|nr:uracil-DNA glycosylase [Syntrophales bacterium]
MSVDPEEARRELLEIVRSVRSHLTAENGAEAPHGFFPGGKREKDDNVRKVPPPPASRHNLDAVRKELGDCRRCALHEARRNIVFGEGNPRAALMFIGEGPGEEEDKQGRPFVGRAGQLLDRIIQAMGLRREDVFIANIVKCRPPKNRAPKPQETEACAPFLEKQIAAVRPRVICALGTVAAQHLLKTDVPVSLLRGRFQDRGGIRLMATYHPAYLLRNPQAKKQVWEDMKKIMEIL